MAEFHIKVEMFITHFIMEMFLILILNANISQLIRFARVSQIMLVFGWVHYGLTLGCFL